MQDAVPPKPVATALWAVAVFGGALGLTAPLLIVDVPPLLDYPNHLARAVVLAFAQSDPAIAAMYAPHWDIIPNLAVDILLPPLLHVLPIHVAGRLVLALALLLPFAGILAYHRATFGRRSLWPVCSALVCCNALFLLGFLNFSLSIGCAFLVAAVWTAWRPAWPRRTAALCSAGLVVTFFCHLTGVVFAGLLIAAHDAAQARAAWHRRRPIRMLAGRCTLLAAVAAPVLALYAASPVSAQNGPVQWSPPLVKIIWLFQPVLNYSLQVDAFTVLILLAVLLAGCLRGLWHMPLHLRCALAALVALYAASPFYGMGGAWIDARFDIMAGFLLFAGMMPRATAPRFGRVAVAACAALFLVRTMTLATAWQDHRQDLVQLRDAIAPVHPDERVLVVHAGPAESPDYWAHAPLSRQVDTSAPADAHLAALLLIERRAFWPLLFTNPAQQPVRVQPAYSAIAHDLGMPPPYQALLREPAGMDLIQAPYLAQWRQHFDWVLAIDAEAVPNLADTLPDTLSQVTATGFAALYRIHDPAVRAPPTLVSAAPAPSPSLR